MRVARYRSVTFFRVIGKPKNIEFRHRKIGSIHDFDELNVGVLLFFLHLRRMLFKRLPCLVLSFFSNQLLLPFLVVERFLEILG